MDRSPSSFWRGFRLQCKGMMNFDQDEEYAKSLSDVDLKRLNAALDVIIDHLLEGEGNGRSMETEGGTSISSKPQRTS